MQDSLGSVMALLLRRESRAVLGVACLAAAAVVSLPMAYSATFTELGQSSLPAALLAFMSSWAGLTGGAVMLVRGWDYAKGWHRPVGIIAVLPAMVAVMWSSGVMFFFVVSFFG